MKSLLFKFVAIIIFTAAHITVITIPAVHASDTAPNYAVSAQSTPPASVKLTAPAGHHFNLEAPKSAKIGEQQLVIKQALPTEITYTLPSSATGTNKITVKTKAFVCDDANTYCVRKENEITINTTGTAPKGAANSSAPKAGAKRGFLFNTPKQALALAKKENKPLLIDFYAIWCPPCNQLDEAVFPSSAYQSAAQSFVTLKLDADKPASWALKEKYNVKSYPTVILASADGKEISRLVGALKTEQYVLAMKAAESGQSWSAKTLPADLAIDTENDKPEVLVSKITTLLQTKAYTGSDWQEQDLWSAKGEAHNSLKQADQAKIAFGKAAKIYEGIISDLGTAGRYNRGYNLELAYTLSQSGQERQAELLYQRLRRRYPNEFTFHYAFSKFLRRQDKNSQALSPAKLAFQHSYGDNKLRAGLNLAQVYSELGSKAQASALAAELISTTNVPASPNIRTHRYIQQLRDFTQTLSAQN